MSTWIPISERMPTREDADEYGNVLWKSPDDIPYVMKFSHSGGDSAVAWLPLPRYTPPKPGPTNAELNDLVAAVMRLPQGGSAEALRRWFADVTARIEKEKGK